MRKDFKYVTVVFKVENHDDFKPLWNEIFRLLKLEEKDNPPFRATAISLDNEMKRLELVEEAMDLVKDPWDCLEIIGEILGSMDVHQWDWKKHLEEESPGS